MYMTLDFYLDNTSGGKEIDNRIIGIAAQLSQVLYQKRSIPEKYGVFPVQIQPNGPSTPAGITGYLYDPIFGRKFKNYK
jgi:hypothetical protein